MKNRFFGLQVGSRIALSASFHMILPGQKIEFAVQPLGFNIYLQKGTVLPKIRWEIDIMHQIRVITRLNPVLSTFLKNFDWRAPKSAYFRLIQEKNRKF